MWDIATPIIVSNQRAGYVFSGQFFFDDEPLDYELFRSQAKKYGFNEEEYITALEKVPRLSRESVDRGMSFFMKLANLLSTLRNDETIISSISVTDIFFDVYLGKWNYRAIPKVKTWSYFLTIPKLQ